MENVRYEKHAILSSKRITFPRSTTQYCSHNPILLTQSNTAHTIQYCTHNPILHKSWFTEKVW